VHQVGFSLYDYTEMLGQKKNLGSLFIIVKHEMKYESIYSQKNALNTIEFVAIKPPICL